MTDRADRKMQTRSRMVTAVVAALLSISIVAIGQADRAVAGTPILLYESIPSTTQAGAHPDLAIRYNLLAGDAQPPIPCNCNNVKDILINTPPGLVGSPSNTPRCNASEFVIYRCPSDTQIGVVVTSVGVTPEDGGPYWFQPLYNMLPRPDQLALWGTYTPFIALPSIYTAISSRTESDYGLEFDTFGIPGIGTPPEFNILLWGVPASPTHDELRFPREPTNKLNDSFFFTVGCFQDQGSPLPELMNNEYPALKCPREEYNGFFPRSANSPEVPYVSNPTTCQGTLSTTIETIAYDLETDFVSGTFPGITGCDQLSFDPSLSAKPTTLEADSPSGLNVNLSVPQTLSPTTPSPSQIRSTTVTLPAGMAINPNVADGKSSCSDEEARLHTRAEARCPQFSKVGTLDIESAALPGVLPGAIYIGRPLPGDRYRLLLVADGFSLHIKLSGSVHPDPVTGQVVVSFTDLPQAPFQEFSMHFFGAERGLLATPEQCGTYPVKTEFVPWDEELPNQTSVQFFTIESGPAGAPCPGAVRPFRPTVAAGVTNNIGGSPTQFAFDLNRDDGDQALSGLSVGTPPGFSASLAGIPYCPDSTLASLAQIAYLGRTELGSPACRSSQVGTSSTSVGAGSRPVSLPGTVYLAGPYKGAPLSLAAVTPAVSGPYDLGNVVVRVALRVDRSTAQVKAIADPLPAILDGIPLRIRRILVLLNRQHFAINPTNCDPKAIETQVIGDQGGVSNLSNPFQAANCGILPYAPSLSLRLTGGLKRRGHPAIHAVLRAKQGEANTRRVSVTLPKGELLDNSHIGTVCTRAAFAADSCPRRALIGHAEARTPLLDHPLSGPVYLRSSQHELPDMALDLEGQLDIEAIGRIDSVDARLRATFESVPDVPVSEIRLNLFGGSKGLLQNSETLCGRKKHATARLQGQNGLRLKREILLQSSCAGQSGRRG